MDTVKIKFYISKNTASRQSFDLDLLKTLPIFNSTYKKGEADIRRYVLSTTAESPLTGAGYEVKVIAMYDHDSIATIIGYEIEVNVPACTTGNNFLLDNGMKAACIVALLLLKYWLLKNGCHPDALCLFSLKNAAIVKATPTFLVRFTSKDEAIKAMNGLHQYARVIHNLRLRKTPLVTLPVCFVGDANVGTFYINHQSYHIRVYNKLGRTRKGFSRFRSADEKLKSLQSAMYAEASCYLRIEIDLLSDWLSKNNLDTPADWKKLGRRAYKKAFAVIKKAFWSDFNFRQRRPRPQDLSAVGSVDNQLVNYYFSGQDVRTHDLVQGSLSPDKYFSDVNHRIRQKLRIDYRIPWSDHQRISSTNLKAWLAVKKVKPSSELAPYVFGPKTAPKLIQDLQRHVDQLILVAPTTLTLTPEQALAQVRLNDDDDNKTSDISDLMG